MSNATDTKMTTAIERHEVGHYDDMAFYRLNADALRRDVTVHDATVKLEMNRERTNARVVVAARAEIELPPEIFRELNTTGGSAHSVMMRGADDFTVVGYDSVSDKVDFRGIPKDDVGAREEKAEEMREALDTEDVRKSVMAGARENLVKRVEDAVHAYNQRTREMFVRSTGEVSNWGDDDASEDEKMLREEAEKIEERIRELRATANRMRKAAHEKKKARVIRAIDDAEQEGFFGNVPAEWLEESRELVREDKPRIGGGIFPR